MKNFKKTILKRINSYQKGTVFVPSDFIDICSNNTANKIILRMVQQNIVAKVMRGVYYVPKYSSLLKEYVLPNPQEVANAIARNFRWKIIPDGDTALNILGLSTQVPASWTFLCDGAYKTYSYGKTSIVFKKTTNKNISNLSYKTSLLIHALKTVGKENISKKILQKLNSKFSKNEKKTMLKEAKFSTSWIYENIKKMCEDYQNEDKSKQKR